MVRSFVEEFNVEFDQVIKELEVTRDIHSNINKNEINNKKKYDNEEYSNKKHISLVTGVLAQPVIKDLIEQINNNFPKIKVNLYTIINEFFGKDITVAGLITGQDIIEQLKDKELGTSLLLSNALLKHGEHVLLDDLTIEDIEEALQTKITVVNDDGGSFLKAIIEE